MLWPLSSYSVSSWPSVLSTSPPCLGTVHTFHGYSLSLCRSGLRLSRDIHRTMIFGILIYLQFKSLSCKRVTSKNNATVMSAGYAAVTKVKDHGINNNCKMLLIN